MSNPPAVPSSGAVATSAAYRELPATLTDRIKSRSRVPRGPSTPNWCSLCWSIGREILDRQPGVGAASPMPRR
jgi:hypothetical protein